MWYMMFYWLFGCCFTQTDGTKPQGSIVYSVRRATGSEENGKFLPRLLVAVPFPPPPSHLVSIRMYYYYNYYYVRQRIKDLWGTLLGGR